jgi:hypothetical protein
MSQLIGNELTVELFDRLKGEEIGSHAGKAITVVTVDEEGWAHPAMLSYCEVVAKNRSRIDLAVGRDSTTAKNLKRRRRVTLLITDHGINYYVKATAEELRESMTGVPFMSLFRLDLEQVLEDQEPGAVITSGVTFSRSAKRETIELVEKVFDGVRKAT